MAKHIATKDEMLKFVASITALASTLATISFVGARDETLINRSLPLFSESTITSLNVFLDQLMSWLVLLFVFIILPVSLFFTIFFGVKLLRK